MAQSRRLIGLPTMSPDDATVKHDVEHLHRVEKRKQNFFNYGSHLASDFVSSTRLLLPAMTEQLRLVIVSEQEVKFQMNDNKVSLRPLCTKDGSLSIELELFRDKSYSCQSTRGRLYCGKKRDECILSLKSSKCLYPVMVHCTIRGIFRTKLVEKMQRLLSASSEMNVSVQFSNNFQRSSGYLTVKIVVYAIISSSPRTTVASPCLHRARLDGTLCDVKLVVEGIELWAHRIVLAARSSVLLEMLTNRSEEFPEVRVEPEAVSKLAVEKFLEFLYTDQVEDWAACEVELLQLAAKYKVPELTDKCMQRVVECEGVEALMVLHADGLHGVLDRQLHRLLTAVVVADLETQANKLADTMEWKEFESSFPVLAHTMYRDPSAQALMKRWDSETDVGYHSADVGPCLNRARLDGNLCDVKLVVEGIELSAHRVVLAARSPVLNKMLTGSFKEAAERCVKLEDCSREVVEKFLEFLYTDLVIAWESCVVELMELADMYDVPKLRSFCERKLWDCDPLLALKVLLTAGYSEVLGSKVRRRLSNIVLQNLETLDNTKEWVEFQEMHPTLADSILCLADHKNGFLYYDFVNNLYNN
ncbi:Kelch-like ECH-associated protein 1B [Frankliniella fusca]|uniref:Kelch-like ECH-associated protein 1B n=1 Tax=Frankliniella fusca TaxID=407009 RepID=A0AAE1LFW5_9NEOP|nr:Kelch-like ECH-associated protein 1B [Frankliniella fusca]